MAPGGGSHGGGLLGLPAGKELAEELQGGWLVDGLQLQHLQDPSVFEPSLPSTWASSGSAPWSDPLLFNKCTMLIM